MKTHIFLIFLILFFLTSASTFGMRELCPASKNNSSDDIYYLAYETDSPDEMEENDDSFAKDINASDTNVNMSHSDKVSLDSANKLKEEEISFLLRARGAKAYAEIEQVETQK